jgi:hypothetical protein
MRWLEEVENDLRELHVKKWKQKASDGQEQKSVAKDPKGPHSQGVSNLFGCMMSVAHRLTAFIVILYAVPSVSVSNYNILRLTFVRSSVLLVSLNCA